MGSAGLESTYALSVISLDTSCQVLLGTPLGICQLDDLSAAVHPIPGLAALPSRETPLAPSSSAAGKKSSEGGAFVSAAATAASPLAVNVLHIATSPDGSFVAAYTSDTRVHVFSSGIL